MENNRLPTTPRARLELDQLVFFSSLDDPFDVFRALLFAVPASAVAFWLPVALLLTATLRHL